VLDKVNGISIEGFGEIDVFGVLLAGDRPLSGVNDALSPIISIGLCLLVGYDELVLLHMIAELFAEGELGMGNDIWFGRRSEFVDQVWVCCLGLIDWVGVGCHVLFIAAGVTLFADGLPHGTISSHCVGI
jgi:hypothetical protein